MWPRFSWPDLLGHPENKQVSAKEDNKMPFEIKYRVIFVGKRFGVMNYYYYYYYYFCCDIGKYVLCSQVWLFFFFFFSFT